MVKGDAAEDYWILCLDKPIDVAEDLAYPVPDENRPQLNQRELQVNLDDKLNADYAAYQKLLGKKVEVTGELSQGFAWTPFIRPLVMRQFPVVSVCCFAATQGSGGRRA